MGITVELPPALALYAQSCVDSGRFGNLSEVVGAALRLQQEADERRAAFVASLEEAVAEGERDGFVSLEEAERVCTLAIERASRRSE